MTKRNFIALFVFLVMITALSISAFADETDSWYDQPGTAAVDAADDSTVVPQTQQIVFPDVKPGDWFYEDVMKLYESGVISGFPDGSFRPSATVTTGQALKMILLSAGHPEPAPVESHWARGYLDYAIEQGFLVRFKDITDLDIPINRSLTAKLASQALGLFRADQTVKFSDTNDDYVCALSEIGVIGGYPDGTYRPNNSLTRAELSAICSRIRTYLSPSSGSDDKKPDEDTVELRISEKGVQFIKDQEGFVKYAMWDYAQYSIGYGSRCDKDEYPDGITEEQADKLLRQNIKKFEESVDAFLSQYQIQLSEQQYDAIISFAYNLGTNWFRNGASSSKLAALLISGNYTENELAGAFGIWCHVTSNGTSKILNNLVKRRILETQIFLYGDYGTTANRFCYVIYETEKGSREFDVSLYKKGQPYGVLCKCSCDDDDFLGWFCEDGTELTADTIVSQSQTVTAKWRGYQQTEEADPGSGNENPLPSGGVPGSWY